jgi:hypothetical protein
MPKSTTKKAILKLVPRAINKKDSIESKFYFNEGVKFGTKSNWQKIGLTPKAKAVATVMTTTQGFQFDVFAEVYTEVYNANAELLAKAAKKEHLAKLSDLYKAFREGKMTPQAYAKATLNLG